MIVLPLIVLAAAFAATFMFQRLFGFVTLIFVGVCWLVCWYGTLNAGEKAKGFGWACLSGFCLAASFALMLQPNGATPNLKAVAVVIEFLTGLHYWQNSLNSFGQLSGQKAPS